MITAEIGGKRVAKGVILSWLKGCGGSNLQTLETATGLPQKLLAPLLAEMMKEKAIHRDRVIFKAGRK